MAPAPAWIRYTFILYLSYPPQAAVSAPIQPAVARLLDQHGYSLSPVKR